MHRLFVGLRPPAPVRAMLATTMAGVENARWQDDDQLHITLRFIGDVSTSAADDVAVAIGAITTAPFDIAVSGVGSFATRGRNNALWAGVTPQSPLAHLHRKIDQALIRLGLPPEARAYLPHITLARLSGAAGPVAPWIVTHANLSSAPFAVSQFCLFESHLGRDGAYYEIVARYPIG